MTFERAEAIALLVLEVAAAAMAVIACIVRNRRVGAALLIAAVLTLAGICAAFILHEAQPDPPCHRPAVIQDETTGEHLWVCLDSLGAEPFESAVDTRPR